MEDDATIVALASLAADFEDDLAESTDASREVNTKKDNSNEQWQHCYEGFFDMLADEFAKIMGCDENCVCCECGHHSREQPESREKH